MAVGILLNKYFKSVGILLAVTGAAKFISAFGRVRILEQSDPVFGISYRHLFEIAALLEIVAAIVCMIRVELNLRACLASWLSTVILAYRVAMSWNDFKKPCPCLGTLTDAIHISARVADISSRIVLVYMLVGSYSALVWLWWQRKTASDRVKAE